MADEKIPTRSSQESTQRVGTENRSGQESSARGGGSAAAMTMPAANAVETVVVAAGAQVPIAFSLDDVEMTVVGGDLQLGFDNGATLVLQGFATQSATDNPPTLVMADGTVLPGDAVVFSSVDTDIAPAAGPALTSGGVGTYRSDLGQVIEGVGRLGVQDPGRLADTTATVLDDETAFLGNEPPLAGDDVVTTPEDQAIIIPVLANDSDPDGDALTIIQVGQGQNGTTLLNADGTVTYTPGDNFNGTDSFTYTISDGQGGTDTATVIVNVSPFNDPPDALDDQATTPEDTAVIIPVLDNDTDLDGDTLTVEQISPPSNGQVTLNADGTVTYTPGDNFNGTDSFTYTISDGQGGTDTATVVVNVTPVNDTPQAADDFYATDEDVALVVDGIIDPTVLANDNDLDLDTLTVNTTPISDVTHGSLTLNADGTFTYVPTADFNGNDSFVYQISDGAGGTAQATAYITVIPVNDAPQAADDFYATDEDVALVVDGTIDPTVLANDNDLDLDTLTVNTTPITDVTYGSLTLNADGTFTYVPAADFNGNDSFVYQISDGAGGTAQATAYIVVNPINDPPLAVDDAATTTEDAAVVIPVLTNDSDPDGDPLDIVSFTEPALGSVTENADGTMSYDPQGQFEGLDDGETATQSYTYTISDGQGGTDSAEVTVTIEGANDPPVAVDDGQAVNTAVLIGSTNTTPTGFYLVTLSDPDNPNAYSYLFDTDKKFDELSYDSSGTLWGAENSHRQMYTIDLQTGELTLQLTLPEVVGNDIDGFTFGNIGGEEKLYVLGGSSLFVIDPITAEVMVSYDLSDSSNDLADLVLLNSKLYTVSSNGSFFEINLDDAGNIALDGADEPAIDLLTGSAFNSVYGLVAGSDGLLYVVTSTGNSGEASALAINSAADSYTVNATWELDASGIGGNFFGLAGQVNPVTEVSGNVLTNDYDPDNQDGVISDLLTVVAVNGNPLDDPGDPSDPVDEIELTGSFGTLTMSADGSYTYHLTDELTPGVETFSYTISDGSAQDSAELTFYVNNYAANAALEGIEGLQALTDSEPMVYSFSANGGEGDLVIDDFNVETDILRLTDVLDLDGDGGFDPGDVAVAVTALGNDLLLTISGADGLDTNITLADVGSYHGVDSLEALAQAGFQVEYTG